MKKLFLSLVALVCATVSFAQNTLVATLTHGDEIKMFYGFNAYKEAYNAATSGDVINLSGGKFSTVDITKAVSVRGTGVEDENPTIFSGNFFVNIPDSDPHHLTIEGIQMNNVVTIYGSTTNPCFMKCYFLTVNVQGNAQRVMFISSTINNLSTMNSNSTSQYIGCNITAGSMAAKSTDFINCVLSMSFSSSRNISNSIIVNCIVVNTSSSAFYTFPNTTTPISCISVGNGNPFTSTTGSNNISGLDKSIFVDSDVTNDLTDEAKTTYLGYDGTPVGMYGGAMPRNMIPSYPRITKMNVAKQTTADGKLSVDIEVSAAK